MKNELKLFSMCPGTLIYIYIYIYIYTFAPTNFSTWLSTNCKKNISEFDINLKKSRTIEMRKLVQICIYPTPLLQAGYDTKSICQVAHNWFWIQKRLVEINNKKVVTV